MEIFPQIPQDLPASAWSEQRMERVAAALRSGWLAAETICKDEHIAG